MAGDHDQTESEVVNIIHLEPFSMSFVTAGLFW